MPCLIAAIAFFMPRLVMFVMWLTGDYLGRAYQTVLWPLLGFFFLPYTTLTYAWAQNAGGGLHGWYLVVFIIAILFDLGCGGDTARRSSRKSV